MNWTRAKITLLSSIIVLFACDEALVLGPPADAGGSPADDTQTSAPAGEVDPQSCTFDGVPLHGKVQVVDAFPDFEVEVVDAFPDLEVELVDAFPDDCGEWEIVDAFPDFTIEYVDAFPDFTIEYVDAFPGVP